MLARGGLARARVACLRRGFSAEASATVNPLRWLKPVTNGQRGTVLTDRSMLYKGDPYKALTVGLRSSGGRNHTGRITVRHRGGGHKRLYRMVDFKRRNTCPAEVERIEYDPNRSARIALIRHDPSIGIPAGFEEFLSEDDLQWQKHTSRAYIIAPIGLEVGHKVFSSLQSRLEIKAGNSMPLMHVPLGTIVHNVELVPGKGAQLARSAGTSCQVLNRNPDEGYVTLRLQSMETRMIHERCLATIGVVSNPHHMHVRLGKAGRSRWLGKRPKTRGMAMNPCDHPMGGGNGKSKGRVSTSPWGWTCKGRRTRKPRKYNEWRIVQRCYENVKIIKNKARRKW